MKRHAVSWLGDRSRIGYIDTCGEFVVEQKFLQGEGFADGLAYVTTGSGGNAFIDHNGDIAIDLGEVSGSSFINGLARIQAGDKFGYINSYGKVVWDFSE